MTGSEEPDEDFDCANFAGPPCARSARAEVVQLGSQPYALDSDDFIQISFSVAPEEMSIADITLPVSGDTFGDDAATNARDFVRFDWPYSGDPRTARIYLGSNARLRIGGIAEASRTARDSPSALVIEGFGIVDLGDRRVRNLQRAFDNIYRKYQPIISKRAHSADSCLDSYYLSYSLEGLLSMYEATRSNDYLEQAMHYIDSMLASAADLDGDGYLDLEGTTHTLNDNKPTFNISLCDWKAGRPVARLARLMDESPELSERYSRKRLQNRSIVDKHLVRKWAEALNQSDGQMFFPNGVYFAEVDTLIHRVGHYGDIVVDAWVATGEPDFEPLLDSLMARVCTDLQDSKRHPGAVEWDIFIRPKRSGRDIVRLYGKPYDQISDTSHANGTVSFLVAAVLRANRRCANRDVLGDLAFTFREAIATPPNTAGNTAYRFADFVDGGLLEDGQTPYSIGRFIEDGWLKLGEVDPEIQAIAQSFYDNGEPLHRVQFLGNLARNYALASWQ